MIELRITKTCMHATTGRHAGWQRYDTARKEFPDKATARAWIAEEYGRARRAPMYRDTPTGAQRAGYVVGFRCKYRNPGDAIMEQHWIEFRAVEVVAP
jgi:hypothetical protein